MPDALLSDIDRLQPERLYHESRLVMILFNLVRRCSTLGATLPSFHPGLQSRRFSKGGLAIWQIRHVMDYRQSNLAQDIGIEGEPIRLTGLNRAKLSDVSRRGCGRSPTAQRRIRERAS